MQLEWIYEKRGTKTCSEQPLVIPPAQEIEILYELAMLGSMRKIRERAIYLEELDEKYLPFANKLKELAKGFKEKEILDLVKKYLH